MNLLSALQLIFDIYVIQNTMGNIVIPILVYRVVAVVSTIATALSHRRMHVEERIRRNNQQRCYLRASMSAPRSVPPACFHSTSSDTYHCLSKMTMSLAVKTFFNLSEIWNSGFHF